MTIGITGPRRRAPWRGAVVVLIIAAIVLPVCLILLGLTGDFLVDWLWFSTIGYLGVFWTTIAAEGEVFFAVFVVTAMILWVNGSIASRFGLSFPKIPSVGCRRIRGKAEKGYEQVPKVVCAGKFPQPLQNSRNPSRKIPVPWRREFCCKLLNLRVDYGADSQNRPRQCVRSEIV